LGVVLYEMLVGEPPFRGENPVTIAYKHVQEAPVPPRELGVDVAESLEAITLKLLAKNPAHRYPSAEDLRADLRRYREGAHRLRKPVAPVPGSLPVPREREAIAAQAYTASMPATPAPVRRPPPPSRSSASRTGTFAVLIVLVLIVLLAILFLLFTSGDGGGSDAESRVDVPNVINKPQAQAEAELRAAGFEPEVQQVDNEIYPVGQVFDQDPKGGVRADEGSIVRIQVSQGNSSQKVPTVIGSPLAQADAQLKALGFNVVLQEDPLSSRPAGEVVGQDPPAGANLAVGGTVTLTVSNPTEKEIPDVKGQDVVEATATLTRLGFVVERRDEPSEGAEPIPEDKVTRTDPPAGQKLRNNDRIILFVSSGLPEGTVPQLVPLTSDAAIKAIQDAGFQPVPRPVDVPDGDASTGRVITQTPPAGSTAKKGTTVEFTYGRPASAATTTVAPTPTTAATG
jgi:serine/threonine-protein kinase